MLPDRESNPGSPTYESGALPIALCGPAIEESISGISFMELQQSCHSGWSGGGMVLGKLSERGRPNDLDYSRARVYWACSRCGCGFFFFWTFFSHLSCLFSLSFSLGDTPI